MFLKNTSGKDIKLPSFEGYAFAVPPGISAIWDKAGEQLLSVHKVELPPNAGPKDKFGFDNGHGLPALWPATKDEWAKDGKKLVTVTRFKVNSFQIPRAPLILLALKRGINRNRVTEYQMDNTIEKDTIVNEINELPVPDEIRYPVNIEEDDVMPVVNLKEPNEEILSKV